MNFLLADQCAAMRMNVKKNLCEAGFADSHFDEVEDGATALERIKDTVPDVVFCDWNIPQMSGVELLQALQELRTQGIEIAFGFVTTQCNGEMRDEALRLGAHFLIAKPFTPGAFARALDGVVGA